MTEVQLKLQDAATQMKLASAHTDDESIFRSCINSYISCARTVTFVMEKESSAPDLKAWYKCQTEKLGRAPLFRFFNSQRVYSIHKGVIQPKFHAYPIEQAEFRQEISPEGKSRLVGTVTIRSDIRPADLLDIASFSKAGVMTAWRFDNVDEFIPGDSGNVLRLCEQHFLVLKWLVQEWLRERQYLGHAS